MSISLVRWQPWQEMETVHRQLNQLFEEMAPLTQESLTTKVNRTARVPAIELLATENALILKAELPGLESQDLDIQVTREAVSIKGVKQSPYDTTAETNSAINPEENSETDIKAALTIADYQVYRSEFRYGTFHRVIDLPVEVDPDQVSAEFKCGILTLTLPKLERDRNRAVKVVLEG